MNSRNDVEKFMKACDQKAKDFGAQANLYMKLIKEEHDELILAFANRN
jgi:hypothetical protein